MNKVIAGDFWSWSEQFDRNTIIAALRGFVAATGLDWDELRRDAVHARTDLQTETDSFLYDITTDVDPPPMDWQRARSLGLDAAQIETAITHPSHWLKWIAANLLNVLLDPAELQKAVERLFATGRRRTLWDLLAMMRPASWVATIRAAVSPSDPPLPLAISQHVTLPEETVDDHSHGAVIATSRHVDD